MVKKALIAGISNYPGKLKLTAPCRDILQLNNLLSRNGDGTENFKTKVLLDPASRMELKQAIIELFEYDEQRKEPDTVLFYFVGHGAHDYFGYHMVTQDHREYDRGIPVNQLLTAVRKSKVQNKIVILDYCHSGGMDDAESTKGMGVYLDEGVTILTSCTATEQAKEENGQSVFASLLIQALEGGAADLNGNITAAAIYTYIDGALGNGEQRPVFKTNISTFVPIRTIEPPLAAEVMQQINVLFPDPDQLFELNPSFEEENDPRKGYKYYEPYANAENVRRFKQLQKLCGKGLVEPVGENHMYWAAIHFKACRLTPLGQHYWRLAKEGRI